MSIILGLLLAAVVLTPVIGAYIRTIRCLDNLEKDLDELENK